MNINQIRKWVSKGEDERLEFKLKANHPEKIIREMVAFTNTKGGHLIVGVSDDRKIIGLKHPDEAHHQISTALQRYCRPALKYTSTTLPAPAGNRYLLIYHIPKSEHPPHYVEYPNDERKAYFRVGENSIQASPELCAILQRSVSTDNTLFTYGETEHRLMQILDREQQVTVNSFAHAAGISTKKAAEILVFMVLAGVILIHPSDSGDKFSMVPVSSAATPRAYIKPN